MSEDDARLQQMAAWAAWQRLLGELGIDPAARPRADALGRRLARDWGRWPRRYHTLSHLLECLRQAQQWRAQMQEPARVAWALWFHDAIYKPWRRDNEERSARWAERAALDLGLAAAFGQGAAALVRATAHLAPPATEAGTPPAAPQPPARRPSDGDWLVDIDLSILGEDAATYDRYEAAVRQEYFFVPRGAWLRGRGAVLRHFLGQPHIFRTEAYRQRYEARARANLRRALAALGPDAGAG